MTLLLNFFVANGGVSFLLRVAHARRQMKKCFEMIAKYGQLRRGSS